MSGLMRAARAVFLLALLAFAGNTFAAKTYSDNGDGTVTDPTTGLTWMRCSMGQTWDGTTCTGTASTYTFDQANALTGTVTFAGQSDWRLPNIRELTTIVDVSVYDPAIDRQAFPAALGRYFWSGLPSTYYSSDAWTVDFYDGDAASKFRASDLAVRLVRGGQSLPLLRVARSDADYVNHGDGTVTHSPTGLTWKRCAEGQIWTGSTCTGTASTYTWDQANALTGVVTFAGQSDWRLPSLDELQSLVDYTKTTNTKNLTMFPASQSSVFWSNSPHAYPSHSYYAWGVDFHFGSAYGSYHRSGYNAVRLVRGGPIFGAFYLAVSKTGAGTVSSAFSGSTSNAFAGINCGSACGSTYIVGAKVTLAASPPANLIAWGGACTGVETTCTVTMDAAKTVTASFMETPVISGLPATLSFPLQNQGSTSATQTATLSNTGTTALAIIGITASGDFAVTNNCGTGLGVGSFCNLNISFKPIATGTRTGTLSIVSDAPGSPHTIALSGTGQGAKAVTSLSTLTFTQQGTGSPSAAQTLTLSNTGGAALNIASITATGDFARTTTCTSTLAAGSNCSVSIVFTPTAAGTRSGSLSISHDAIAFDPVSLAPLGNTLTVSLSGTGLAVPAVAFSPATLTFTGQTVATSSAAQSITLSNPGAAALSLTSITASGDFAQSNNCGGGLGAGGACSINITFTPTATGTRSGTLTISSNASGSPHSVALTGQTSSSESTRVALTLGWNLLGNSVNAPLDVTTALGNAAHVATVWKWVAASSKWAFYAPSLTDGGVAYAASKGYESLTVINGGEGFWVNVKAVFTAQLPAGTSVLSSNFQDQLVPPNKLPTGWSLISIGDNQTPSNFNKAVGISPSAEGAIPLNITTLWAWDSTAANWYFYAPSLEANGGLTNYISGKGYLDFATKTLTPTTGFWVNKP